MISIDAPDMQELKERWQERRRDLPDELVRRFIAVTGQPAYPLLCWSEPVPTRDTGDVKRVVYLSVVGARVLEALRAKDGLADGVVKICHEIEGSN